MKIQAPVILLLGKVETDRSLRLAGLIGEVRDNERLCLKEGGQCF